MARHITPQEKAIWILFALGIFITGLSTGIGISTQSCKEAIQSYKIYEGINSESELGVNGVYHWNKEYYSIYFKDKKISDIKNSDYHEVCHHLVKKDPKHFCRE